LTGEVQREFGDEYRLLFDGMMEGFAHCRMLYDEKGLPDDFEYLRVNPAFVRLTGIGDAEGRRVTEVLPTIKQETPEFLQICARVAGTAEPAEFDIDFTPLGKWLHVSVTRPQEGEFAAFFFDVSERERAVLLARENEERLHRSLAAAGAGTWEWDVATGENRWSEEIWALYDLDPAAHPASYEGWLESVRPEDRDGLEALLSDAVSGGRDLDFEWLVNTRDGSHRWLLSHGRPERAAGGELVRYRGVVIDVTDRKQATLEMLESEQQYAAIFEHSPIAISLTSMPSGRIVSANAAYCRLIEGSREEILGHTIVELGIASEAQWEGIVAALYAEGAVREREIRRHKLNGDPMIVTVSLVRVMLGGSEHVLSMIRDVTAQKLAEQAEEESRARLDVALASMTDGVYISDAAGDLVDANEAFATVNRFSSKAECLRTFEEYPDLFEVTVDGEPAPIEMWAVPRALRGEARADVEYGIRRKDTGEYWDASYSFGPIRGHGGEIIGSVLVERDVSDRKHVERELQESVERFRSLFEYIPLAVFATVPDGRIDAANPAACLMFGFTEDEIRARARDGLLDVSDPRLAAALEERRRTGSVRGVELTAIRHGGERFPVEVDSVILPGEPARSFVMMRDITERLQAEEALVASERRFRRINDAGLVGVVSWTADGRITEANDRFLEMLGYTREDLEEGVIGWAAITPPEWRDRDLEALAELRATGRNAAPFEKEYYRKDGSRLPILVTAAALDDEGQSGIGLIVDISDQKRAELELRRLNRELEDRVRRRTADLEAANIELESFAYSVSHDLRAPLRHIAAFSGLLAEELSESKSDDVGHFLDRIAQSAAEMSLLIDDLLEFSRVGRAEMHSERVDMRGLVEEVVEILQSELDRRRVDVKIGNLPPATGDRTLLRQVWANLLGNAFKYTRPRDRATIEIGSRREGAENVYWVRDNGVGFDEAYADRLFLVFERLHRSEEFEGTGIGLANVGRILGRHDGRCWAESEVGVGSTFYFALPRG
jgi:PAS domain S-box-containing protein